MVLIESKHVRCLICKRMKYLKEKHDKVVGQPVLKANLARAHDELMHILDEIP